jgi:ATP-binding protein involved in chromosome partitioning
MSDPRTSIIEKRLQDIGRILVFASSKGGVGKSSCAVVSGLLLAEQGYRVGLLDLDFHGATDHIFLGITPSFPEEEGGILPIKAYRGLSFMSIAPFTGEHGVPLRGDDVSNAIVELLAVTIWCKLDYLIIDMPPGMGDELLDLFKYIRRSELVAISTPSRVSQQVVSRFLELTRGAPATLTGVIYNMHIPEVTALPGNPGEDSAHSLSLGTITFDYEFEKKVGKPTELLTSQVGEDLAKIIPPPQGRF